MKLIGCDLHLDLKMYRVPDNGIRRIKLNFPEFEIIPVNVPGFPKYYSDMEVYWGNRINEDIIRSSTSLKWIHFGSLGVNNARTNLVQERGIIITNSKGTVEKAVALTALAFLLSLARGIQRGKELSQGKMFSRESFDRYFEFISDLEGFKVLIVGSGEIGSILSKMLATLGTSIDLIVKNEDRIKDDHISNIYGLERLTYAVSKADAVINLLPFTTETKDIFNERVFREVKPGSFFINVGRGETVVESDLIKFIKNGRIAGVGLDVFSNEPLADDSELHHLPNVLITPHVAAISSAYWDKEIDLFIRNLTRYANGRELLNVVDTTKGY